jgi:MFS family permease
LTAVLAPIFALLMSAALLLMGNGLQSTLLPVRAKLEGFTALEIGVLGSAYFTGFALGCLHGPRMIRRSGHVRAFAAMVAIASTVILAHAMILAPWAWWALRVLTGACFATLYMIVESWLNEKSTNANRGFIFSVYTIINLTVVAIGQLMLLLHEPMDFPLFSIASILVSLAAVPQASVPAPIEAVHLRFRELYQTSPIGLTGCLAVGLANGSFWSLAPLFVQSRGDASAHVAIFMSLAVIAGAIGQWPLGTLSDRIDRRRVILLTCIGSALAGVALTWLADAPELIFFAGAFAYGLFALPLYAISVAHTNDFVQPEGYVEAASGLLLVYAVGAIFGPIVASIVMHHLGPGSLFSFTATVHLAMLAYTLHRMPFRPRPPEEEQIPFADALVVAATTSTVDPLASIEEPAEDEIAETEQDATPP